MRRRAERRKDTSAIKQHVEQDEYALPPRRTIHKSKEVHMTGWFIKGLIGLFIVMTCMLVIWGLKQSATFKEWF